jgi:hypothetical protein
MNKYNNPDDGLDLSRNMLWYTFLIKHAKALLRTKDCCTYSLDSHVHLYRGNYRLRGRAGPPIDMDTEFSFRVGMWIPVVQRAAQSLHALSYPSTPAFEFRIKTTHCRLSIPNYSTHSQLPSVLGFRLMDPSTHHAVIVTSHVQILVAVSHPAR